MTTEEKKIYDRERYLRLRVLKPRVLQTPEQRRVGRVEATKRWQARNPEKTRQIWKDYQSKNQDELRIKAREYRNKDLKKARERSRKWFKEHPEYQTMRSLARWALKRKAVANLRGISTFVKLVKRQPFATCYYCQKTISSKKVHFDHIVALSKGGMHSVENLCVSCATCNHSKFNHPLSKWDRHPQQFLSL